MSCFLFSEESNGRIKSSIGKKNSRALGRVSSFCFHNLTQLIPNLFLVQIFQPISQGQNYYR